MVSSYEPVEWRNYKMDWRGDPHPDMEPLHREIEVIDAGLRFLVDCGVLPHPEYDHERFTAHRRAVRERFEIPWTGISPRMQRLIYAINAIARPSVMVAAGVFCGNTFINNAGAAVGPGAVYEAERLVGIEIDPREAARAERNVRTVDPDGRAEIIAADAVRRLRDFEGVVDLLYVDADGSYLDIIGAATYEMALGFAQWPYGDRPVRVLTGDPSNLEVADALKPRVRPTRVRRRRQDDPVVSLRRTHRRDDPLTGSRSHRNRDPAVRAAPGGRASCNGGDTDVCVGIRSSTLPSRRAVEGGRSIRSRPAFSRRSRVGRLSFGYRRCADHAVSRLGNGQA